MRKARFVIALSLAALLGGSLVWFALGGRLETYAGCDRQILAGDTYRLNCVVAPGVPADAAKQALSADGLRFQAANKDDPSKRVEILYRGTMSDTFQEGREFVVVGRMEGSTFVAKRDTLLTKCPSKFEGKKSPEHEQQT